MTIKEPIKEHQIVCEYWEGSTKAFLARKYGTSPRTVGRMIKRNPDLGAPASDVASKAEPVQQELDVDVTDESVEVTAQAPVYKAILTEQQITVMKDAESETIHKTDKNFTEVFDLIWENKASTESLIEAYEKMSVKEQLALSFGDRVTVDASRGTVVVNTDQGPVSISSKLHQRLSDASQSRDQDKLDGLVNFAIKLAENPSDSVLDELYEFLEACDIEITKKGYVKCFKKVRDDYLDCYSQSFDNSVGMKPSIPRNQVDSNSSKTCSKGLHVCSKSYLNKYFGDRTMEVLVHPADFVSIPDDYYSLDGNGYYRAKARICAYEVIAELST